ncbi:hypothetical protein F5X99DRAFT_380848 [Biscogniauxia marginata]|nr:hypothetical protein F5X99DRAFT_380848 [Biscogniauxia marginata]
MFLYTQEARPAYRDNVIDFSTCRALGTALDWPDAQKHAQQVREWGIKVTRL